MTRKETIIEDVVGCDYMSFYNFFVYNNFQKWFFKQYPQLKMNDRIKFKVSVELLEGKKQ
jgi:hypothetical protein